LPVNLLQFHGNKLHFSEYVGIEEEARGVKWTQQLSFVFFNNRFKLIDIANQ